MMSPKAISVEECLAEQEKKRIDSLKEEDRNKDAVLPVITVNMDPGSRGYLVARGVAERLEFELYHTELLDKMAKAGKVSKETLSAIEDGRLTGVEDFVSSLIVDNYLHADTYMKYLKQVVTSVGKAGRAVVVGRGGNFILQPEKRFAIRITAPLETRINNVAADFDAPLADARKRVKKRESARKSFIRENFHEDIADSENYDLIINMDILTVDAAVEIIIGAVIGAQTMARFQKSAEPV